MILKNPGSGEIPSPEEIFLTCRNMMYHTAFDVLNNREDAEDAVADAMVKICRNPELFRGRGPDEWKLLVRICVKNTAIDRYRKNRKDCAVSLDDADWEIPADGIPEEEDFGCLEQYVRQLSEQHRHILILRYLENLKNREIAELLGIPVTTVATQLLRAKKQLLKLYGKEGKSHETE